MTIYHLYSQKTMQLDIVIYISPIYYNRCENYYNYINNKILSNSLSLYYNYQRIYEKMQRKKSNLEKENYYLVHKNLMNEIKKDNNFKMFDQLLKEKNIQEKEDNRDIKLL